MNPFIQCSLYIAVLLILAKPLGVYMAWVFEGKSFGLGNILGPIERGVYRVAGIDPKTEMGWKTYALAMLLFDVVGLFILYGLQRLQDHLPLNPLGLGPVSPHLAFNTAISFATNTNWQSYGGETTMSYLTQMLGMTVQNFVSAASGLAVFAAVSRGFVRRQVKTLGNFWTDLVRSTLYILLPLSVLLALVLVGQGVPQTLKTSATASLVQPMTDADGKPVTEQTIAVGPVASQIAIKQLGTNGGGFFNANSAHPFENPTPLSGFLTILAINIIGAALCYSFGVLVKDRRQGWALLLSMTLIFAPMLMLCTVSEQKGNPAFARLGIDQKAGDLQPGGNMEGKEARFGIAQSALWATATTAASNGSVNSMHDSFTPLGGLVPMVLMALGEVVYGGVGSGLYGMLMFVIIAVFIAGLMVGRTPEYLGKKIGAFEMKMASIAILVPGALLLIGTAIAVVTQVGKAGILNPGPHGFSEVLYAFTSASNNNGSAFAGLTANAPFYDTTLGLCMFFSRFWIAIPVLAIAGSLAGKKIVPPSAGTLPTHTPLFVAFLIATVILVGALTLIPALALGPIVEHLMLVA